ncbi:MAG: nicotinate (nicotinamide) nucleotide adenylyltransferase [Bacteroides sp.]|nr:nicotinate (nicotinamide) nucleotide adenylyltransferase [Eubacterium sp.]MCM1418570.1 nicotinate (nicotinamide) nucleotide adenylyltransferase [Roseburia sp.]MCM1462625.1 nicotinate (nicotinamide) nucleotide adenylyltransferase [Bacteroides sp.]
MNKVGIFGGAFDPIHNGHTALVRAAAKELKLKETLVIPTAASPHKKSEGASFEDRAEMCRLVFGGEPGFIVSEIERSLDAPNYTIRTVRALKEIYPRDTEFYLILGGDMLFYFEEWYRHEALRKECRVVAAARENDSYPDLVEYANRLGRVKVLNLPVMELSSSEVRDRIKRGESTAGLLDERVRAYIDERGLYRDGGAKGI